MAENEDIEAGTGDEDFDSAFAEFSGDTEHHEGIKPDNPDNPENIDPDNPEPKLAETGEEEQKPEADPFEGWPEEAKNKFLEMQEKHNQVQQENQRLSHQVSSDSGRVSAFQRQINDLQGEIKELRKAGTGAQPTNKAISDAMQDEESWAAFQEEYPEIANVIDKRMEQMFSKVDSTISQQEEKLGNTIKPVMDRFEETRAIEADDEVAKAWPTWKNDVLQPEFGEWLNSQPGAVQSLAASDDPSDASSLMQFYDNHRVANGLESLKTEPDHDKPGEEPGKESVVETEAQKLEQRRQQQLEDGTAVRSHRAHIDPSGEAGSEFEQAFGVFASRLEAKRQA